MSQGHTRIAEFTPQYIAHNSAYSRALVRVGQLANGVIRTAFDEISLTQAGVAPAAVDALAKSVISLSELSWVIARRTLSHRISNDERLTPDETGRWLRAAKICALAEEVLGSQEKARYWLHKERKAFNNQSAVTLMQTEAGARLVEDTLGQLDAGYFA